MGDGSGSWLFHFISYVTITLWYRSIEAYEQCQEEKAADTCYRVQFIVFT